MSSTITSHPSSFEHSYLSRVITCSFHNVTSQGNYCWPSCSVILSFSSTFVHALFAVSSTDKCSTERHFNPIPFLHVTLQSTSSPQCLSSSSTYIIVLTLYSPRPNFSVLLVLLRDSILADKAANSTSTACRSVTGALDEDDFTDVLHVRKR